MARDWGLDPVPFVPPELAVLRAERARERRNARRRVAVNPRCPVHGRVWLPWPVVKVYGACVFCGALIPPHKGSRRGVCAVCRESARCSKCGVRVALSVTSAPAGRRVCRACSRTVQRPPVDLWWTTVRQV